MTVEAALRAVAAELRASAVAHRQRGEMVAGGAILAMAETLEAQAGRGEALAETLTDAVRAAVRDGLDLEAARACWARAGLALWGEDGVRHAAE